MSFLPPSPSHVKARRCQSLVFHTLEAEEMSFVAKIQSSAMGPLSSIHPIKSCMKNTMDLQVGRIKNLGLSQPK